jgi:ABC-type Fe3+-hydroxamate transport system substrate-binding protein
MARPLSASLLPALAVAVLLGGCGSSSSSSSSSGSSAATSSTGQTGSTATTPTATTGSTSKTPTPTGTTGSTSKAPAPASVIASCKRGVQSLPHLRQSTKERLEKICEKAASSDAVAKRKAAVEACRELVNASPLPAGKQRDRALAACKNAGG